jgi:hypothetical protein
MGTERGNPNLQAFPVLAIGHRQHWRARYQLVIGCALICIMSLNFSHLLDGNFWHILDLASKAAIGIEPDI